MVDQNGLPRSLHDLEHEFAGLAAEVPDSPEKRAISVLHGIVMEMWKRIHDGQDCDSAVAFPDIAELHRSAPPMEAEAVNDPLPPGTRARDYSVWREQDGFSERALYVVDPDGVIAHSHVAPYVHHVPDVYELLDALDQLAGVHA